MTQADQFFPYIHELQYRVPLLAWGVKRSDGVTITGDGLLKATFGFFKVETETSNVHHTEPSGGHHWYRAVGVRLSLSDSGLTFGTSPKRGLYIIFNEKIPRVFGLRAHRSLWVSVADPAGLAEAIGT